MTDDQTSSAVDSASPVGGSHETAPPLSEAIRAAVESGRDVRDRVRDVVVSLFQGTESSTASARAAVNGIIQTAADIVQRSAPENPDSVLRNVIDGVTNGLSSVAQTTQYAIQEAASRGQRFASQDIERARKDLNGISDILLDTVKYFTNRVSEETGTAVQELKTHAERSVSAVTPVLKSSLEAVARHPVQTAGEVAGTAVRTGQLTAGALLGAMSSLLANAAHYLDPQKHQGSTTAPSSPSSSSAEQQERAS